MKQTEITKLQREIYLNIKQRAKEYTNLGPKELKKYQRNHQSYTSKSFDLCPEKELMQKIRKSNITYLGDFHTFDQSTKNLERIINKFGQKFCLGVELVRHEHQFFLDAFLSNNLTELEFLESIQYHESWRFPWEHYRFLFQMAKEKKFDVLALNSEGSLKKRDVFAASLLDNYLDNHPDTPILVLFGEYHIVPNKLPKEVERKRKSKEVKQIVVYQNLDDAFWEIKENTRKTQILKFSDHEFSLQTSPPWIKYESLVYWFENLAEDPDFDLHEYMIENHSKTLTDSTSENFLYLAQEILKSLGNPSWISNENLENFHLYDQKKLEMTQKEIKKVSEHGLSKYYQYQVTHNKIFKLPYKNYYYCSNYSINRLAHTAGCHIFHLNLQAKNLDFLSFIKKKPASKRFLIITYQKMLSYFASKIINPHRKCNLYADWTTKSKSPQVSKEQKKIWQKAIAIIDGKKKIEEILFRTRLELIDDVAKVVGEFLSDIFFEDMSKKDLKKSQKDIIHYLFDTSFEVSNFLDFKDFVLKEKNYQKMKKRFF